MTMAMFISGIVIGIVYGWQLALVILATFPIMTVAAYILVYAT